MPLPVGITPISGGSWNGNFVVEPTGGKFGGAWSGTPYPTTLISITLKDSMATTVTESFNIATSTSPAPIGVDSTGIGPIPRGEPYNGTLAATGPFVLPVAWYVAPTTTYPNSLPSGLAIQADGSGATAGGTATISGTYSGAVLTNYQVRFIAIDNTGTNGQTAEAVVSFNTGTNLAIVAWDTVPPSNFPNGFPFPFQRGCYGFLWSDSAYRIPRRSRGLTGWLPSVCVEQQSHIPIRWDFVGWQRFVLGQLSAPLRYCSAKALISQCRTVSRPQTKLRYDTHIAGIGSDNHHSGAAECDRRSSVLASVDRSGESEYAVHVLHRQRSLPSD